MPVVDCTKPFDYPPMKQPTPQPNPEKTPRPPADEISQDEVSDSDSELSGSDSELSDSDEEDAPIVEWDDFEIYEAAKPAKSSKQCCGGSLVAWVEKMENENTELHALFNELSGAIKHMPE